jgi:cytidylate kinase
MRLKRFMPEAVPSGVSDVVEEMFGLHPSTWTLVEHTADTMRRLARLGHVVLVGRGANAVTAGLPNVLHVRLVGPFAARCKHAAEFYKLSPEEAERFVRENDRTRAQYMRRYFHLDINDPLQYDLTINTGRVGFESATQMILEALGELAKIPAATALAVK